MSKQSVCIIGASGKLARYMVQHALERSYDVVGACRDVYSLKLGAFVKIFGGFARMFRIAELEDQVEACRKIFVSTTKSTVVRASDLQEGDSQGVPILSRHVGDPVLQSNLTRRIDFYPVHG